MTGLSLLLEQDVKLPIGEQVSVSLWLDDVEFTFPAQVTINKVNRVGLRFNNLSIKQQADLIQCTFARAEAWENWTNLEDTDHPLQGLKEIASLGIKGYRGLWQHIAKLLTKQKAHRVY